MTTKAQLSQALNSGERLQIIYDGGSQPGTVRVVEIREVGREKMRALCVASGETKTFSIEKVRVVDEELSAGSLQWQPDKEGGHPRFGSIRELHDNALELVSELGWHVEFGDDYLSLHRRFKSGKPLKGADVELTYTEYSSKSVFDFETGESVEMDHKKRERPWTVRAKDANTRTYRELDRASVAFFKVARELAPIAD